MMVPIHALQWYRFADTVIKQQSRLFLRHFSKVKWSDVIYSICEFVLRDKTMNTNSFSLPMKSIPVTGDPIKFLIILFPFKCWCKDI